MLGSTQSDKIFLQFICTDKKHCLLLHINNHNHIKTTHMEITSNVVVFEQVKDIVDISKFYSISITEYEIRMQGSYDSWYINKLKAAGFDDFYIDDAGFTNCSRTYDGVPIKVVLS
jgi:hypothetical protein